MNVSVRKQKEKLRLCRELVISYNIVAFKTFGNATAPVRKQWRSNNCDEVMTSGRQLSCAEKFSLQFLDTWKINGVNSKITNDSSTTSVDCFYSILRNKFCRIRNVVMDFAKMQESATINNVKRRYFQQGFVVLSENQNSRNSDNQRIPHKTPNLVGRLPGFMYVDNYEFANTYQRQCDEHVTAPTYVISNDDHGNLFHHMNDVMTVWSMLYLSNHSLDEVTSAMLLNVDGFRRGGPGGSGRGKLLDHLNADDFGEFKAYFESWFTQLRKAIDYKGKSVCFSELYFTYSPGYPWVWLDYNKDNECSLKAPSPLYQSFLLHIRQRWLYKFGKSSVLVPPTNHAHIVILLRSSDYDKKGVASSSRHILNSKELVKAIKELPNVRVTAVDMSTLSFLEQYKLASSASVFVGMHGAQNFNIFHASVGHPNCCAFLEIFPIDDVSKKLSFHDIKGYGNIARLLGLFYFRYEAVNENDRFVGGKEGGTRLDVVKVTEAVSRAVATVLTKSSCFVHTHTKNSKTTTATTSSSSRNE